MKKTIIKITLPRLVAVLLALLPIVSQAQGTNSAAATNSAPVPAPAERPLPFHGAVTAVDNSAMTLTIGNRVFTVTSKTRIGKSNHVATLSDITVGDLIGGSYRKNAGGKLEAISLRVIPHVPQNKVKASDATVPAAPGANQ